jgi:uncharacterized protein (DUF1501 family)
MTDRRNFLKTSCAALTMTAMATQMRHFGLINALAQDKEVGESDEDGGNGGVYKALVCVFLAGGNDSNNTVIPNYAAGYAQYSAARAVQGLAIPQANLLPISPPSMNGNDYGFHPSMTDLHTLFNQNKLAVITNVGTLMQPLTRAMYQSGATRPMQLFSHSDQVDQFKTAISNYRSAIGWGGRLSDRTASLNVGAAIPMISQISTGANVFTVGNSSTPLIVAPSPTPLNQVLTLNGFAATAEESARQTAMTNMRGADLNYTMTQAASVITQQAINVSQQLSTDPVLTATFPNTTLGNQLRQVAKLMKFRTQLNMKRQVFYVQLGGFDTHSNQLINHANLWTQVSQALKAFYDETVAQGISDDVTTFTMSDFNRTLNPAGSGSSAGSDHAWGGHHFVMGGAVLGGNFYGRPTANGSIFPTLVNSGPDDAESRGRIIPSVSVEQYTANLARWFGLSETDMPLVFPNINAFGSSNLGFMM